MRDDTHSSARGQQGERFLAKFETSDSGYVPDSAADDAAADFVALVPLHTNAMLRVTSALVGPADAEDAAQEAAVRAWQAWGTLRDRGSLRPWLLRITVNVCRQWQRGGFGRRVRLVQALPEESGELLAVLDVEPGGSDHAVALDLRAAVNGLREELRVVATAARRRRVARWRARQRAIERAGADATSRHADEPSPAYR